METQERHHLGTRAKVLLSSVFGPYARDDAFGSRKINPMELYHNQVTRVQEVFSLRMFHRSFGLLMIQANLEAPCTVLDFPDLERFVLELREKKYDIVGISSIITNVEKVKAMCALVRKHRPEAVIVVGGHVTNLADIGERVDADHFVKGEGVRWFREYLGQDTSAPVKHPAVLSANVTRILGHTLTGRPGDTAAVLIPSVGCPMGCNFCSTSALFGGKGNFFNFYETGDELFAVMLRLEEELKVESFFVMDENFLLHRSRALRLLELIKGHGKRWELYVFSSGRVLESYSLEQLVDLGVRWVWIGLEGEESRYGKLAGVDMRSLVKDLQSHGIRVLGSSIVGLENHHPGNIDQVLEYAVSHETDFHQFMLYTPIPGTPLHREHALEGTLLDEEEMSLADSHGQYRFNYRHRHIPAGREEGYLLEAFRRDFERNGPSLFRLIRTTVRGWQRYKNHPDRRIRDRYERDVRPVRTTYAGAVWAMKKWYAGNKPMQRKTGALLREIYREFGWKTKVAANIVGRYLYVSMKREAERLDGGWTPEPECFYEMNPAARALSEDGTGGGAASLPDSSETRREFRETSSASAR